MIEETYKDAGVDVSLGNVCSRIMYEASKKTWENRRGLVGFMEEQVSSFSGKRNFDLTGLPRTKANMNSDGVGTKMEVAEALSYLLGGFHYHRGIPADLLEMSAEDAAITGAEPAVFVNILDVSHLNANLVQSLADGLVDAAAKVECAVVNGETAELGDKVGGYGGPVGGYKYALDWIKENAASANPDEVRELAAYALEPKKEKRQDIFNRAKDKNLFTGLEKIMTNPTYNWSGAMLCLQRPDRVLDGSAIEPGHAVVALYEQGLGSNGLSLVRRTLTKHYGKHWPKKRFADVMHEHKDVPVTDEDERRMQENPEITLGEIVLTPCTIYTKALLEMHGGYSGAPQARLAGAAHITGGGIPEKLGRLLKPTGFGAELDNLFLPCTITRLCQKLGGTSDREACKTWNMGQRILAVTPDYDKVVQIARKNGFQAQPAGKITEKPTIRLRSKGHHKKSVEEFLEFPIE